MAMAAAAAAAAGPSEQGSAGSCEHTSPGQGGAPRLAYVCVFRIITAPPAAGCLGPVFAQAEDSEQVGQNGVVLLGVRLVLREAAEKIFSA